MFADSDGAADAPHPLNDHAAPLAAVIANAVDAAAGSACVPSTLAENETRCAALDCGKVMIQPATGRRRTYCSPACRVRAHRRTRAAS